jgi:Amt family ammonium transporter
LKRALKYDDSLDAFGVHGVCGIVGALLVGFLAYGPLSATTAVPEGLSGGMEQFIKQVIAVAATMVFTAIATWILLKITDVIVGLRVTEEEEREGLDVALHGERIN